MDVFCEANFFIRYGKYTGLLGNCQKAKQQLISRPVESTLNMRVLGMGFVI